MFSFQDVSKGSDVGLDVDSNSAQRDLRTIINSVCCKIRGAFGWLAHDDMVARATGLLDIHPPTLATGVAIYSCASRSVATIIADAFPLLKMVDVLEAQVKCD